MNLNIIQSLVNGVKYAEDAEQTKVVEYLEDISENHKTIKLAFIVQVTSYSSMKGVHFWPQLYLKMICR